MRLLLDTHTFLWWNLDAPKLSQTARDLIGDGQNDIFFSAASAWEISIKYGKGRLTLPEPPNVYVPNRLNHYRFIALPIQISHSLRVHELPDIHLDPFDRLLVTQSRMEQLPLLTSDQEITQYDAVTIW